MGAALQPLDSHRHRPLVDHRHRAVAGHRAAEAAMQIIEILAVAAEGDQAMAAEGALQVVAGLVLRRMAGDGHVVVVDHQLHVQSMGHGEAGRLGVIALLLGTVGAEAEHGLAGMGQGHAVHERPEVPQAAGAELHTRGETQFRVARQPRMGGPVLQQHLRRQLTAQHADQILRGHPVARLVEEHRQEAIGCPAEEGIEDHHLRHGVVRPAAVTAHAPGRAGGREEDDRVAAELDVGAQGLPLAGAEAGLGGIEAERPVGTQIDREGGRGGGHGGRGQALDPGCPRRRTWAQRRCG